MAKFKVTYGCKVCGHRWKKMVTDLNLPDPPCPNLACGEAEPVTTRNIDFNSRRAPAAVGMSNKTKAIDETARIVMNDYGMTDLRDDVREGESSAPKLPPRQQAMADGMFNSKIRNETMKRQYGLKNPNMIARAAIGGGYSPKAQRAPDPVAVVQESRTLPPVRIINKD